MATRGVLVRFERYTRPLKLTVAFGAWRLTAWREADKVQRTKAIEAFRMLNDFVGDLVAGARSLELFESSAFVSKTGQNMQLILRRMCLSHLIVTLSKWAELYDQYKAVIPADARSACLDLRKEIEARGIREFRNKVMGHIWEDDLKRPLVRSEVDKRLAQVLGDSQEAFLLWVNNPTANVFPRAVVAICESVREGIRAEHGLEDSEVFGDAG